MVVHRAMLRRIYDWCIDAAHKPYALWIMGAVSFAESSFFPVPPDVMLIPMVLSRREMAWWYATIATVASVLGGLLWISGKKEEAIVEVRRARARGWERSDVEGAFEGLPTNLAGLIEAAFD